MGPTQPKTIRARYSSRVQPAEWDQLNPKQLEQGIVQGSNPQNGNNSTEKIITRYSSRVQPTEWDQLHSKNRTSYSSHGTQLTEWDQFFSKQLEQLKVPGARPSE